MKIHLLYFAQLRDIRGRDRETIEIRDGMTVEQLQEWLLAQSGCEPIAALPLLKAVNEEWARGSEVLRGEDRVAFVPPVAGG